jgi:hypothetical protein
MLYESSHNTVNKKKLIMRIAQNLLKKLNAELKIFLARKYLGQMPPLISYSKNFWKKHHQFLKNSSRK